MRNVTAIVTAYRRPDNIGPLVKSIRGQNVPPAEIWAWANEPGDKMTAVLAEARLDRLVTSRENAFFHGRFALALLAKTEFVAIFDDDSLPGQEWFANCLATMSRTPGILGTAGVVLHEARYANRTMHGWQRPSDETIEVDLVCQAWFLRTEWVKHLFAAPPVTGANGEDIELAARGWRMAGIRSYCPPHPADHRQRWGSTRGLELGMDAAAASLRAGHLTERETIVAAELAAGWQPLFLRSAVERNSFRSHSNDADAAEGERGERGERNEFRSTIAPAGSAEGERGERNEFRSTIAPAGPADTFIYGETSCGPKWVTQHTYPLDESGEPTQPACITLRIDGLDDEPTCCLECLDTIESLGGESGQFDRIDCGGALERVRDPLDFLRRARRLLNATGQLAATVANVRHESVIRGLLEGHWKMQEPEASSQESDDGKLAARPMRFFTRREIEKLFYRAGFHVTAVGPTHPLPSREDRGEGAQLLLTGLSEADAADLHTERYAVGALPETLPDYGLTSIVIVTHNQLGYTHACLESIRFVTDEPYELIVVDNGSCDGTIDYLKSCGDVTLIENPDNRGFPAAANQGVHASRGAQVLLLNNDVLVTTGWLRRMLEALGKAEGKRQKAEENPKSRVGLVGPLTNCASGYQEISADYTDLACLDGFAWEHGKQHAGLIEDVDRLIGFCLLVRREVIDQIGDFDERFGIGNYEDDDYCRRACEAGWRLVVARDAFIHHFGHRTFDGAGVDLHALLTENRQLFEDKWAGEGSPRSVEGVAPEDRSHESESENRHRSSFIRHLSSLPPHPSTSCALSPVLCALSLCMIVRDNASTIRACLESIRPWVDEMIVVDTGSTDATPNICRELGAQVFCFPWPDSFAIARNESLKHARGEWIFWMDSDDVIDADNGRKLRELVAELVRVPASTVGNALRGVPPSADPAVRREDGLPSPSRLHRDGLGEDHPQHAPVQVYSIHHAPRDGNQDGLGSPSSQNLLGFVMQVHCPSTGKDGFIELTVVDHVKLFRNLPELRFEGRIHEQIIPAIRRAGGEIAWTDLFVVHAGADQSAEGKARKIDRDLKLLDLDLRDRPDNPFVYFNLGMTYGEAERWDEAVAALERSLALSTPGESQVRKTYALLAANFMKLGRHADARQACAEGLRRFPHDCELLFRQAMLAHDAGSLAEAERDYLAVLCNREPRHFTSIDAGVLGYKTHHNLAIVYADLGALEKAEAQWRQAVADAPDYRDGWRGLGETLMQQGKFAELDRMAADLVSRPALRGLGLAWQAQPPRVAGKHREAAAHLQRAIDELPNDPDVVQAGCQLLFEAGDPAECERAITHLLRLAPDNPGAHHNLGTLLLRSGRFAEAVEPLRKSLALAPKNATAQVHLHQALANLGPNAQADGGWPSQAVQETNRYETA